MHPPDLLNFVLNIRTGPAHLLPLAWSGCSMQARVVALINQSIIASTLISTIIIDRVIVEKYNPKKKFIKKYITQGEAGQEINNFVYFKTTTERTEVDNYYPLSWTSSFQFIFGVVETIADKL